MYPVRVSSSVATQTDQDLREIAERIEVPVALIIRQGVEEKVASLKKGLQEVDARKAAQDRGELYVRPEAQQIFADISEEVRAQVQEIFRPITEQYTGAITEMLSKNVPSISEIIQGVHRDQ